MSTALKSKIPSGADEFELPETLSPVVEDLKKEQQTLKKEIDEVKATPVVRKQDESTRVFNLRQHQMELKLQELEEKKKASEKELQEILQQKNSTLHTDLRKLAQFILQETRKVNGKIEAVSALRNELQLIFESNLNDRKKQTTVIEEQTRAINDMGSLIRDTSKLLQGEFHFLSKDIERIQREKEDEIRKLSALKEEVAGQHGLVDSLEERKKELRELEQKIYAAEKSALSFAKLDDEIAALKKEIARLAAEKDQLAQESESLKTQNFTARESLKHLKHDEAELEHSVSGKRSRLTALETDLHESRKRLEASTLLEHDLESQCQKRREELSFLQCEISKLEAAKTTHLLMADESRGLFEERKIFYQKELDLLKNEIESKRAAAAAENECLKLQWESEFRSYCEKQKELLRAELETMDRLDLEEIRNKKNALLKDVQKIMTSILSAEGFQSTEEKSRRAAKEVETTFEAIFGKTRRWKFW